MKNLTLCPLSFLSPPRSLVSRDEIFFAFHFAKISISFPRSGKKITSILLFVRNIFNIKEKKIKILEIRKIINRASSLFQIKAIRYIPRLFSPFFYNRNNTLRREENKRKKRSFVRYFVTVQLFRRPLVCGVVALNRGSRQFIRSGMQ